MRTVLLLAPLVATVLMCGCSDPAVDATEVAVIGAKPKLVDPFTGALSVGDRVLLANVARGLVMLDGQGEIVPGLAERWNVSDDGVSYIFRLEQGEWPDGRRITARDVARMLRRQIGRASNNELKDAFGAIDEIVPMTERVVEIRLKAPRPELLQLLAQPELGLMRDGSGTGPFEVEAEEERWQLNRRVTDPRTGERQKQLVSLRGEAAEPAVRDFVAGKLELVVGGTADDLPIAQARRLPRNSLRFDPAIGLFGLVPARKDGPIASLEVRQLLTQSIDRDALVTALRVPGLAPRATLLQPGLSGLPAPVTPAWTATPLAERLPAIVALADEVFGDEERPTLRVALPPGPGGKLILRRLTQDWGRLGIQVMPADQGEQADLALLDRVAPSLSPAWFLRRFRCAEAPICSQEADELLAGARAAPIIAQRLALLGEASRMMEDQQLFIPLAAPIRWSLVSRRLQGFQVNAQAQHPLWDLESRER